MKKNSWVSLTLLFVTYFTLGWKLSEFDVPPHLTWFLAIASILVLAVGLSFPLRDIKALILRWFSSDIGAFLSIIVGAFVAVVIFAWMHLFATCLLLISAGALARLDIQMSGWKNWRAFAVLATISLTGVGLGGAIEFWLKTGRLVFS
ncbi:hypothetical protein Osc7112_4418 [Oscillatoria nigro-viridis PCC 7112]|uniref:Uncharacterized protein n=1 Tax=Phormidium nigroviride PCC 7112 TaxID=179408 RepID=K9VNB6_9CYAN|nr:hypothetical protein [Oscillatoria nigro-viridis]AFZ08725.1 hypothetical protein Osc7112_4418 [Oscillatoria nigro-viridis PCC 7112]